MRPLFLVSLLFAVATASADKAPKVEKFGAALSPAKAIALTTLLKSPDAYASKTVVVDGKVRAACMKKGCWMELAPTAAKGAQGCRVTFKDYGFFVPTNSAGADVRVEGVVATRVVPAAEVAHLEAEGATFAVKEKDGSARELSIVATGVELRR
jgi:hypothetical protein